MMSVGSDGLDEKKAGALIYILTRIFHVPDAAICKAVRGAAVVCSRKLLIT